MLILEINSLFGSFRMSHARSYGETYPFVPPSTVYGMLLSLAGETNRAAHIGVGLAFAYANIPRISTRLRQSSPLKYGMIDGKSGAASYMDKLETLSEISFLCWIDSTNENREVADRFLEQRIRDALEKPENTKRTGVLSLGTSDDIVDDVRIIEVPDRELYRLRLAASGRYELPVWVDHVGVKQSRWVRYDIDRQPTSVVSGPAEDWPLTAISPAMGNA